MTVPSAAGSPAAARVQHRYRHRLEALALRGAIALSRLLGPETASNLGGRIMRSVGPLLSGQRVGDENIRLALPHLSAEERASVLRASWDNLGRTAAELPHLAGFRLGSGRPGWEIEGGRNLLAVSEAGGPAILFSGHLANWEVIGPAAASLGVSLAGFYRAASNPLADEVIQDLRRVARRGDVRMFAKGSTGAREALAHLKSGGFLGMMMDQKMNDGIPVEFFGRPAMTAPALAHLALRFGCPVLPVQVVRLGPARFRVICEAPLPLPQGDDRAENAHEITLAVNRTLERWIRAEPGSWLWPHRRWPRERTTAAPDAAAIPNRGES